LKKFTLSFVILNYFLLAYLLKKIDLLLLKCTFIIYIIIFVNLIYPGMPIFHPKSSKWSIKLLPINPAPPVTSIFI